MTNSDTIVARATSPGRSGVAIIRVSGPAATDIGRAICGVVPEPRQAGLARFLGADGNALDFGLCLYFQGPASFTGEDVIEFHGHGGEVVANMVLERCLELGARRAEPGEFSRRAFLNDKLDLSQAEAIADIIDSGSRDAARAAVRSLEGVFSAAVHHLTERLTELRMYVEAAIDFPEEEIDFLSDAALSERIQSVEAEFLALMQRAEQGRVLTDGYQLVIVGAPNAGKSSLMNALAGADSAIVTPIAGTTRDLIREQIDLDGLPVTLIDTAGLRDSPDAIEAEGIRRAREALKTADHALLLVDASESQSATTLEKQFDALQADLPTGIPFTRVLNKTDLAVTQTRISDALSISATERTGLTALRERIRQSAGLARSNEGSFSARRRHIESLEKAFAAFSQGVHVLHEQHAGELMAEELRLSQKALGEITGEISSDDLLGKIFGEFCIGK